MPSRRRISVRAGDLQALRDHVAELGRDDPACTERLLGQLAALESLEMGDVITFVPFDGCEELAARACAELAAAPLRRR